MNPHDLLQCSATPVLPPAAPDWVHDALEATPWVVVRRARARPGRIAVGVRGPTRSARFPFQMSTEDAIAVVTPEELARRRVAPDRPALRALELIGPVLDEAGVAWGPTGSVGFELATHVRTVTADSDLDLIIRMPRPTQLAVADEAVRASAVRIDCQVETQLGAVALAELTGGTTEVLLRTADGPRLIARTDVIA
ncbi:phosphoribosyl-dephospho-CoA transferase [Mycolicibacterium canariasense]|uniref:Phosphoribosyl-dephospho-CoA transferase n=1 Tax=Mycolicibacterium canariasense TaxID=228230 RepID=A0A100WBG9_MYCCR|nr:malonate decarboxylase holo-ACP synthase [Mycolicibacterium canariasense]MCV7209490.1 malonate decarboxylase holo-ACP synthase [Mycolicibacterium canariasense]GAS94974.1 phosphoribosyl-dephospho-CoA transferase [Mycolicibacterium canariasense]